MDDVSLQPAAGAQGEFAGVLMIRAYHLSRGERRHKVLIPDSAHGTNPASTALAGFTVVELKSEANGEVDLADLERASRRGRRGVHDHPAQHAGAVRVAHPPDHRDVPRQGRAGLHGRRELQRHPRHHAAGRPRLRRLPLQPAQDVHHAARRRRAGGGAGGDQERTWRRSCPRRWWSRTTTAASRSTGSGRSRSASSRRSGATSACSCARTTYIRTMGPDGLRAVSDNAVLNANYILQAPRGRLRPRRAGPLHARVRALGAPAEEATA